MNHRKLAHQVRTEDDLQPATASALPLCHNALRCPFAEARKRKNEWRDYTCNTTECHTRDDIYSNMVCIVNDSTVKAKCI